MEGKQPRRAEWKTPCSCIIFIHSLRPNVTAVVNHRSFPLSGELCLCCMKISAPPTAFALNLTKESAHCFPRWLWAPTWDINHLLQNHPFSKRFPGIPGYIVITLRSFQYSIEQEYWIINAGWRGEETVTTRPPLQHSERWVMNIASGRQHGIMSHTGPKGCN